MRLGGELPRVAPELDSATEYRRCLMDLAVPARGAHLKALEKFRRRSALYDLKQVRLARRTAASQPSRADVGTSPFEEVEHQLPRVGCGVDAIGLREDFHLQVAHVHGPDQVGGVEYSPP